MDSFNDVLAAAKEYCKQRLVDATYNLYIDGLEAVRFEGSGKVTLAVRNDFICTIVRDRYTPLLREALAAVLGFDVEVELVVPAAEKAEAPVPVEETVAIATEIKKNHPEFNIVYVDCETFTNELITAIQAGRTDEFRQTYRPADVLLVDDIQFIAGKESTQEEFFHTFNTLHGAGKQIVLASDRPAKEIKSLEERLRTRFEWGLTADIQPPDFETRVAIIRRKAELLNLHMPDEVSEFIANHLKSNIRQLEGAVKKLNAYYLLEGIQPAIGVAQNAIKDILNETQPVPVTIEKIISEVARTYNVSPAEIRGMRRTANISSARQTAIYVVREITGMSMEDIGREFSGRDHSTIVYSLKAMEQNLENDRRLKETVEDIIKNVRS